jgi:Spy/CpxP family protein refolding chaperone
VLVTGLAATAFAQAGQPGLQRRGGRMAFAPRMGPMALGLGQLGLTDAQRDQVRAIMERHRDDFRKLAQQEREARRALQEAVTAEGFNESAIRTAGAKVGEAQTEAALLRARVHEEVWTVLTPEQREKAKTLKAEREQRMKERRQRMQQVRPRPANPGQ